ncbi:glycosyltransferase family 4 protein [Acholeplasma sp. OttesenSCG-928-E16]|nr:glycosyltransferase family 4 protein [Acholeplasma sp. OttesenSCG-928-E16]
MKIGIDCRYLGKSGIGVYLRGILDNLDYTKHDYLLLGKNKLIKETIGEYLVLEDDTDPFSLSGLLFYNKKINDCDVIFIPHFIVPYGIKPKVFTTIHDLIALDIKEYNNNKFDYLKKKYLIKRGIKKATHIFSVSNFTKNRIDYFFKKHPPVSITYNGLSKNLLDYIKNNDLGDIKKENYLVYVGNIKKHKGIDTLIDAANYLEDSDTKILIIGSKDNFREKNDILLEKIKKSNVLFTGKITSNELYSIIARAKFLIQPSRYEGFGIPPLEAYFLHTEAIISDISVFKEIYGGIIDNVFKVNNAKDLANRINQGLQNVDFSLKKIEKYDYKNVTNIIIEEITKR